MATLVGFDGGFPTPVDTQVLAHETGGYINFGLGCFHVCTSTWSKYGPHGLENPDWTQTGPRLSCGRSGLSRCLRLHTCHPDPDEFFSIIDANIFCKTVD